MEIRFCDLCNESVPASDFNVGQAIVRKGKVTCAACMRAMGGAPQASSKGHKAHGGKGGRLRAGQGVGYESSPPLAPSMVPPRGPAHAHGAGAMPETAPVEATGTGGGRWTGAAALFMATGALAAAGTGMLMLTERIDAVEQTSRTTGSETLAAIDAVRAERSGLLQPIEGRIGEVERTASEAASGIRAETSTEVAALHARLATAEARSTELRSALDATRRELEQARAEAREALGGRDDEIASLQKVIQFHGDSLVELRERIREAGALVAAGQVPGGVGTFGAGGLAGQGAAGATQPGAAGSAGGPAAAAARWAALLPDLKNPDEAQRLTAVLELGETGDPAVGPHIVPMLKDTDSFVRMVSVQALGDLKYKPAVPHLIEALSDDRWTVREAARDSLRTVTGKNFGFDPTGRDLDMKKKIDQWRSWWRREGDDFLTQA